MRTASAAYKGDLLWSWRSVGQTVSEVGGSPRDSDGCRLRSPMPYTRHTACGLLASYVSASRLVRCGATARSARSGSRRERLHPPVHTHVVDFDAAFGE